MTPTIEEDSSLLHMFMAICSNCAEIALYNGNLAEYEEWKLQLSAILPSVSPFIEPSVYAHSKQTCAVYSSTSLSAARAA
jgi:hypothetical protein